MRGLIGRARALLTAKTPAEQLDEVRAKIREASAEVARLDGEIAQLALPILRGDTEAARVAVDLEREKMAGAGEIATMRTAEAQLAATVAAEERAAAHAAASALPRQVAEQAAALLAEDDEIMRLAGEFADVIKARISRGYALAELVGSVQLKRANDTAAHRIRSAIANAFRVDLAAPNVPENNLLRLVNDQVGARSWLSLRQVDQELLDDECAYYPNREAADEAVSRLGARNTKTLVHPLADGTFMLIRHDDLYVDRAASEAAVAMAAKVGFRLVATPYRGGWMVRAPRAADAALTEQAA